MQLHRILLMISLCVFCGMIALAQAPRETPPTPVASPQAPSAPAPNRGGGRGGPVVVSPQIEVDGRVTFRVPAPNATSVTVGGDVNGSLVPDPSAPSPAPTAPGVAGDEAPVPQPSR